MTTETHLQDKSLKILSYTQHLKQYSFKDYLYLPFLNTPITWNKNAVQNKKITNVGNIVYILEKNLQYRSRTTN